MKKTDTLWIGFMLFALFFGAGNLIYPPEIGMNAGTSFWWAITGFIVTGVGLPIIAVTTIALVNDDAKALGNRVHPMFGLLFTSAIYLAIGPFFGIPRAANVAYEMGMKPLVATSAQTSLLLFGFTVIFFILSYWVSLNPSKIVDRIGQWLTPALLLAIVALIIASFFQLDAPLQAPNEAFSTSPFFKGFLNGYLTMDAIAGLAFGIIVVTSFKNRGVDNQKDMIKSTIKAGLITGFALAFVYASIGWMGAKMASVGTYDNGGAILSAAAKLLFGSGGSVLIGIIVALACFTTTVGLTVACAQYFSKTIPKLSYRMVASVVTAISFLVANMGLNQIIAFSVPVLVFIYPLAIVLIALAFLHPLFKGSPYVYQGALLLTSVISIYDGLVAFGVTWEPLQRTLEWLPLFSEGIGWLLPALVGGILGWFFGINKIDKQGNVKINTPKAS